MSYRAILELKFRDPRRARSIMKNTTPLSSFSHLEGWHIIYEIYPINSQDDCTYILEAEVAYPLLIKEGVEKLFQRYREEYQFDRIKLTFEDMEFPREVLIE